MEVLPTEERRRRRWLAALALAALGAIVLLLATKRRPREIAVTGLDFPGPAGAAPEGGAVASARLPVAPEPDAPEDPPAGSRASGRLTFADLDRLLGADAPGAAKRFEREILDDPALPTHLKVAVGRRVDSAEAFRKFLTRLSRRGGESLRVLAAALLADPASAERLRNTLAAGRGSGSYSLRAGTGPGFRGPPGSAASFRVARSTGSRSGGSSAGARGSSSAGPGAHDIGRLKGVKAVGKDADARKYIASVFASMPPEQRRELEELCEEEDICDPAAACAVAGLLPQCEDACRKTGTCPPGGLTPEAPGRPDGGSGWTRTATATRTRTDTGTSTGSDTFTGVGSDTDGGTGTDTGGLGTGTNTSPTRRRGARKGPPTETSTSSDTGTPTDTSTSSDTGTPTDTSTSSDTGTPTDTSTGRDKEQPPGPLTPEE